MAVFFTSDSHFGHARIIDYCSRPFKDVQEMDEALIANWNSRVSKGDLVYHLGDFALVKDVSLVEKLVRRLNGQIHLILGNHDRQQVRNAKGFVEMTTYREIKVSGKKIVLFHFPILSWNKKWRGSIHLHGHSHGAAKRDLSVRRLDVGVDAHGYRPISLEEVLEEMNKVVQKQGEDFESSENEKSY